MRVKINLFTSTSAWGNGFVWELWHNGNRWTSKGFYPTEGEAKQAAWSKTWEIAGNKAVIIEHNEPIYNIGRMAV